MLNSCYKRDIIRVSAILNWIR